MGGMVNSGGTTGIARRSGVVVSARSGNARNGFNL